MAPLTRALALVPFLLASRAAVGEVPAPVERPLDLFELGAPSFTSFSVRDGLPESVVETLQTDAEGFVWIGYPGGAGSYDGRRWTLSADLVPPGGVKDLLLDHTRTLWASLWQAGIARREAGHWMIESRETGLPSNRFRRMVETVGEHRQPELWALSIDGMVLRREHEHWVTAFAVSDLPPGPVLTLARTHRLGGQERLWIGTFNAGVWYRDGSGWKHLRSEQFDPAQVESLLVSENAGREELWISTFGSGLWRFDDAGLRGWTLASGELPTDELYSMAQTKSPSGDRAIWVASRSGLIRVHGDHAQVFDRRHGLPSNVVRDVRAWSSPGGVDVLWAATEAGVARTVVGSSQWQTASLLGAGSSGVFGVLVEPDGHGGERLWAASSADGVGLYEDGRWQQFTFAGGTMPDRDTRMVRRAPDERGKSTLWIGLRGGSLLRTNERRGGAPTFSLVPTPWEPGNGQAVMDVLGRRGEGGIETWFATRQSGVYRWRRGAWTAFRPAGAAGPWRTVAIQEQIDGTGRSWLWATSNQGLGRFDGTAWTLFGADIGLSDVDLRGLSLLPDERGRQILWSGSSNHGIERIDVSDPLHPRALPASDLPPPLNPTAYSATRDSQGRIYICTNTGVQMLTARPGGGWTARAFSRRDGMVHEECNTNAQLVDAHDRFWTGTLGGLTVFDPGHEIVDRHPKPLKLTGVSLDGAAASPSSPVRVEPGVHELRIDYALLSWQRESESTFRTRLVGYETKPGEWTMQSSRTFSALPPGSYTLRVEGRDYAGNVGPALEVAIEVVPAWWQRVSANALFVLAAVFAAYGLLAWRTRALRGRGRRLEEQVQQRTTELHAANERLRELSYKDALTGLANRRQLLERLEPDAADGRRAHEGSSLIFVDVDHFKAYNDRYGHPAGDEALRAVADVLRACLPPESLAARYGGEEFACFLENVDPAHARALAEAIRAAVEARDVPVPGTSTSTRVTISAGVASAQLESAADAHRLLRDADIALYQAKRDGRNCVRG